MGLLEDLLEGTSAVADTTLDKGSQALRQGQKDLNIQRRTLRLGEIRPS